MQKKILIVEDEVLIGMMLSKDIQNLGYEVCGIATSGADGVRLANEHEPDLVLMDVNLNDEMSGIQAAETIQSSQNCQFIIMSGYRTSEIQEESKHLHPVAVLDKLGPIEAFEGAIKEALI